MTRGEFLEFLGSLEKILPFEASNALAHTVLEDGNYDNESLLAALGRIDRKEYTESAGADFINQNPHYIPFVRGILNMMLYIREDIRDPYEDES